MGLKPRANCMSSEIWWITFNKIVTLFERFYFCTEYHFFQRSNVESSFFAFIWWNLNSCFNFGPLYIYGDEDGKLEFSVGFEACIASLVRNISPCHLGIIYFRNSKLSYGIHKMIPMGMLINLVPIVLFKVPKLLPNMISWKPTYEQL